ncbi:MAG: hypothetical protein N2111_03790, partial [Candidatus Sumerlaeaceae bacterium]|nr:hypothetical protein [Candidatus Sumerlaeaceae bacterium]
MTRSMRKLYFFLHILLVSACAGLAHAETTGVSTRESLSDLKPLAPVERLILRGRHTTSEGFETQDPNVHSYDFVFGALKSYYVLG